MLPTPRRFALFILLFMGAPLAAQSVTEPEAAPPDAPDATVEDLPWAIQLGLRVRQVQQAFPLVNQVVLVPDGATYVDEISRWSPRGRWPVVIEDSHFAPKFIRRFKPKQVIRRDSVGDLPRDADERRALLDGVPVRAWGADPAEATLTQVFDAHQYTPCGAVVVSERDPAWTAAIALAAGRGQPLIWIDTRWRAPNATLDAADVDRLQGMIETSIEAKGFSIGPLGMGLSTVTLCRSMATKVNLPRPDNGEVEPAALTDYLGRRSGTNDRAFYASMIFGDEVRSAYVAMCSLFLPRERVTFYNTYPTDNEFAAYAMSNAESLFRSRGYETARSSKQQTTEAAWLATLPGGSSTDVFVMNSRGREDEFHMREGVCSALDVPTLNEPAAVHWTHSWSMRIPEHPRTVAARWLDAGAYAYVGSVHEPYLGAFLPPDVLAERWVNFVPFLVAARHWSGRMPFAGPWKVNLYGDPLMLVSPPAAVQIERLEPSDRDGENVLDHARAAMQRIEDDDSGAALREAMDDLVLLGRDELVRELWTLARQRGWESQVARPALGPLFRAHDVEEFLAAWRNLPGVDAHAETMLWHLMTVRLGRVRDQESLLLLQSSVREILPHVDAGRLAPSLESAFGRDHVRDFLSRLLGQAEYARSRRQLEALLKRY